MTCVVAFENFPSYKFECYSVADYSTEKRLDTRQAFSLCWLEVAELQSCVQSAAAFLSLALILLKKKAVLNDKSVASGLQTNVFLLGAL